MQEAQPKGTEATPSSQWQFKPDEDNSSNSRVPSGFGVDEISWTASEFMAHQRTPLWFITLGLISLAFSALVYLLSKDIVSSIVVVVVAILFGAFAARQPRVLEYKLSNRGITIGGKHYDYAMFKSFSVIEEGALSSILFIPLKRFMPTLTVYYDPDDEEKILQVLHGSLPMERRQHDPIDRLMRKIRF